MLPAQFDGVYTFHFARSAVGMESEQHRMEIEKQRDSDYLHIKNNKMNAQLLVVSFSRQRRTPADNKPFSIRWVF